MASSPLTTSTVFHNEKADLFTKTESNFQALQSQWKEGHKKLENFEIEINNRSRNLQHRLAVNPGKAQLEIERANYLNQHLDFKETVGKIEEYVGDISKKMVMFMPKVRTYSDEKLKEQPDHEKILAEEQTCKNYLSKLQEFSDQATSLKTKYIETLTSLSWSLQRYCQIVDNEGKPISMIQRATNNIMNTFIAPAIPKPNASLTTSASSSGTTISQPQPEPQAQSATTQPSPQPEKPESQAQPQSQTGKGDVEPAKGNNASSPSTPNLTEYEKTANSNKPKNPQAGNTPSKRDSADKSNKS